LRHQSVQILIHVSVPGRSNLLPSLYLWKVLPNSSTNSYILDVADMLDPLITNVSAVHFRDEYAAENIVLTPLIYSPMPSHYHRHSQPIDLLIGLAISHLRPRG
jgi:hypothetical protein